MYLYLVWLAAIAVATYLYFRRLYSTFSRAGVNSQPTVPFLGNMANVVLKREHLSEKFKQLFAENPTDRFVGFYEFIRPTLLIQDIELLKNIVVKDFEHFVDHRTLIDGTVDPLFGRILFNMQGQEWKHMRGALSPAFTSSKIKLMVPLMVDVGHQMMDYLKKMMQTSGGQADINVVDLTTRFANDVIASCAFGTKVDSHNDVDNYFYTIGKTTTNLGYKETLKFFGYGSIPSIMKALKVTLLNKTASKFYRNLILSSMMIREEKKIVRHDMIHLLMEAKKGKLAHETFTSNEKDVGFAAVEESTVGKKTVHRDWADDELVAQAVGFFMAGFETVSSGMSWLLHELALNPDIQNRLYLEIKKNDNRNGGKFDYKSIQEMKYLDMVLSESLRKWPPAQILDRVCTKDYNCGKPNDKAEKDYIIRKGQAVIIPILSFHRNPQFYPEPLKFDPDRFSDENKHQINPFAYMPFGLGPRNCTGSRFALIEIKVLAYMLLQLLEVSPCEKTCLPEQLENGNSFNLSMKGGHWLRFNLRN